MVSETKKAVFGLSSTADETTTTSGTEAKVSAAASTTTRFIFDVIASLTVLYFYTLFYVIPHFLLTKIITFACAAWARLTATERFQQCKGYLGTKSEQIWTQRLAPIATSVQDKVTGMRFYPLLKEKAIFVYETLIVSVIELVKRAALTVTKRLTAIWNDKTSKMFEYVNWSVGNLSKVKQHIVELKACKQTAQFVQQAVIARAIAVWNTQLLVLMTVVKQAIMGKLNKKFTIVQPQQAANTVQFEEVKASEATSEEVKAPVETTAATTTSSSDAPAEETTTTTTSSDNSLSVNRKLVFETAEPAVAEEQQETVAPVEEQEEEAPKQEQVIEAQDDQQQQQPLLQPAAPVAVEETAAAATTAASDEAVAATTPVPAVSHEEQEAEQYEQQQQQQHQHHGASPRKNVKKHKNKNK